MNGTKVDGRTLRADILRTFADEVEAGNLEFTVRTEWSGDYFPSPELVVYIMRIVDYAMVEAVVDYVLDEWLPANREHMRINRRRYVQSRGYRFSYDERHLMHDVRFVL